MSLILFDDTPTPAFDLNFLGGMPAGLTYTNSSTERVYWDSTGTRRSAVANEPIFETLGGVAMGMRWEMEQRTNLATNSEGAAATWAVSNVSDAGAPIAGFSASLQFGDNSVLRTASKTVSITSGTVYSISAFVQMDDGNAPVVGLNTTSGDLYFFGGAVGAVASTSQNVQRIAGNIYRCTGVRTAAATGSLPVGIGKATGQSARTFRVVGIQVEAAASASSYIPTAGSAVTRQPDVLTATSISPWYRQDEGTVVFEGIADAIAASSGLDARVPFAFSNGSSNELVACYYNSNGTVTPFIRDGGVTQTTGNSANAVTAGTVHRIALSYKLNDCAQVVSGGAVLADTSATMPTVTQLNLGTRSGSTAAFMGYARRLSYYNSRLPNTIIQGLSRV